MIVSNVSTCPHSLPQSIIHVLVLWLTCPPPPNHALFFFLMARFLLPSSSVVLPVPRLRHHHPLRHPLAPLGLRLFGFGLAPVVCCFCCLFFVFVVALWPLVLGPATFFPSICSTPTTDSHAVSPHRLRTESHWSSLFPFVRICPARLPLLHSPLSTLSFRRKQKVFKAPWRFFSFFSFFSIVPRAKQATDQAQRQRPRAIEQRHRRRRRRRHRPFLHQ